MIKIFTRAIVKKLFLVCLTTFFAVGSAFAQAPTITSFSPASGPVGISVTITGTNFNTTAASDIVFFGATMATVTAASTTGLTVTVPVGATYQPISVLNGATALAGYSAAPFATTFTPNKGSITAADISPKVDFATGTAPYSVAIGDLDGDGRPDLAVANFSSNTVSIFRNITSSGSITAASFAAKVDFATGSAPISVAIGDLDGDGKPDLAVANEAGNTVSVLRNTSSSGSISFAGQVAFATGFGSNPYSVAIGDLDGDGKPDLAVANHGNNKVSVFRNTSSSGSINFATKADFATGTTPGSVAIGDLDGDGKPDLAVANEVSNTVSVFRNTSSSGSINFATKVDFATGTTPGSVAIGDLDGDGKPDLAVTNEASTAHSVSILGNTSVSGSINFDSKVDFQTGNTAMSVAIGDLDGDGKPDLAVSNYQDGTVSVLRNTTLSSGSINFNPKVDFATGGGPRSVAIGDLDGDGKPDLALANGSSNTVSVLRDNPVFPPTVTAMDILGLTSATPASAAFSLRLLSTAYTGKAVQVRRSTDNALQDIGFAAGGGLDTAALKTFIGSANGYVNKWYDQSGNGNDATQTGTISNQPRLVNAGVVDRSNNRPAVVWDNATGAQVLTIANSVTIWSFVSTRKITTNPGSYQTLVSVNSTGDFSFRFYGYTNFNSNDFCIYTAAPSAYFVNGVQVATPVISRTHLLSAASLNAHTTASIGIGTSFLNRSMTNGSNVSELVLFPTAISTADRVSAEASEAAYYMAANANLGNLSISAGTLSPGFGTGTTAYTATVPANTSSLTVTPMLSDPNATMQVRVNGGGFSTVKSGSVSQALALVTGTNTIDVQVTAQDAATVKTYTTTVTKLAPIPTPTITAAGSTTICSGSTVTLTADPGFTYQWFLNGNAIGGATASTYAADQTGKYTVQETNASGGSAISASSISVYVNQPPVSAITASGSTTICQGDSVILKSSGSNLGNALSLNGTGGYVNVPPTSFITNLGKTGYTLEAWIKPISISGVKSIVRKDGDYNFYLNNGTVAAEAWVNGTGTPAMHKVTGTVQNVTVGKWTHVAATWDPAANTMSIYINGVAIPTTTVVESVNASGNFLIGVSQTYGQPFAGEVDELRVWNTPRTAAQIADYRNSFISASTPGLAAYYKFDEGTGATTADATGNGNNGTLEPGASWVVPSDVPVTYSNYLWSTGATTDSIIVKNSGNYTLTVQDANGCSSALSSQTVTVNPLPAATITAGGPTTFCPSGAVTLTASAGSSYLWNTGATTPSINVTSTGSYTVRVTNANGCSATSAPTAVLVQDLVSPVFTSTQANTIVALDAITGTAVLADYTSSATATDNCSVSGITQSPLAGTPLVNSVPTTVTLTASDPSGNTATQSFTVTATDQTPPVVLTKNITVYLNASGNATITPASVDNGSTDNVGITTYSLDKSAFDCTNVGANTVNLTAGDAAGNHTTASAIVTVQDTTKPIAIAQAITVQLDATGNATITPAQINNGSTDNCAIATYALDKTTFDCSNVGANTVTLTVTDTHGNASTATAVVTVQDNIPPVVITQNITVQLDATGNAAITPAQINNGSTDNCAIATYALDKTTFDCSTVGANTVTLTVTDVHGNVSTATAVVTVQDTIPPVVITQNITVYLSGGNATITPAQVDNGSNDACGIKSLSLDQTAFDCSSQGDNTVTLTVTDNHGNVSTGTAVVTVIGKTPTPSIAVSRTDNTFTGLDANTIALGYGAQSVILTASNPISPNSSTYSWSPSDGLSNTNIANPEFKPTKAGTYTFNVLVTSEYGCQASASVTINVMDVRCGDDGKKVAVCFKTNGKGEGYGEGDQDSKSGKPRCVSTEAVGEQLEHGGNLCACACQINNDGNSSDRFGDGTKAPVTLIAYPNPFGKHTTVSFTVPTAEQNVTLNVYNTMGKKVATLYSGGAGANQTYSYPFDGAQLQFGVYFVRLTTSSGAYTFRLSMLE
jgi:hypothetical protein